MPPKDEYEEEVEGDEVDDEEYEEYETEENDEEASGVEEEEEQEEEEAEEEEEEEEEEEDEQAQPWTGISKVPERQKILAQLADLKAAGQKTLTILVLGKSGSGKSSTVNSLLGEQVMRVSPIKLQPDTETTVRAVRQLTGMTAEVDGMKVRIIDTCGLEDPEAGDTVNHAAMQKIAQEIKGVPIDVVLYVDRLDFYRVEPLDKAIMESVSNVFGKQIWSKTLVALTHGNMQQAPPGTTFESFADRRANALRSAIPARRGPLGFFTKPSLPVVLIENSESCPVSKSLERILPDGTAWLPDVYEAITDMALGSRPYVYKPSMTVKVNNRGKWLIPLFVFAQYYVFKNHFQPKFDEDDRKFEESRDFLWEVKAADRKRMGLKGGPLKPSKRDQWRLEQMYHDD